MLLGHKDIYRRLLGFDCFANGMWKKVSLRHNRAFETFFPLAFSGYRLGLRTAKSPPSTCRCKAVRPLPTGVGLLVGPREAYISSSSAYSSSSSCMEGRSSSVAFCTPEMMKSYAVLGFFCNSRHLYTFFPPGIS